MNRRQAKKAYKKKYGHNPPKTEIRFHSKYWGRKINTAVHIAFISIKKAASVIAGTIKETIERVESMSDEEFTKLLNDPRMDAGMKAVARKIRIKR